MQQYLGGVELGLALAGVLYALALLMKATYITSRRIGKVGLDVKDLAAEVATTTVVLDEAHGGQSFDVVYKPNVVTTKWVKGMRKAENEKDEDRLNEELLKLLSDWDLTSGGKKFPLNADTFSGLPLWLTTSIIRQVMRAATGGVAGDEEGKAA